MELLRRSVGWILLAISLVLVYQGYGNAHSDDHTESMSRRAVCEGLERCQVRFNRPREIRTDVIQRRYEWKTNRGPRHAVCRRELLFFGDWSCEGKDGSLGTL